MKKLFLLLLSLFIFVSSFAGTVTTSGITAATIIARAKVYLDASSDPFYESADYVQWVDEAVRETVNRTGCLEAAAITVALVANTNSYTLGGSTFLKIVAVEHDNGDTTDPIQIITLDRVHKDDIGHNNAKGRPQVYCVWNNKIQVWPTPRTDYAATNLYVYTVPIPTGVSATNSSIETPTYLDVALLYYVVAQAHYKNKMMGSGDRFMALWEKRIAEYNALVLQRKPVE